VAAAVAAGQTTALQHFLTSGWREGRNPDAFFDVNYYLQQNPDVAAAGINPLLHYDASGFKEGRNPSALFDTALYLAANSTATTAGSNALQDYLGHFADTLASYPVPSANLHLV